MSEISSKPVAFITGAAVGIGKRIAERLAQSGYDIALTYHSSPADDVVAAIEAAGSECMSMRVDVTDSAEVSSAVSATIDRFSRLDLVITNAGGLIARQLAGTMSDEHWHRVIDVNLSSTFYVVRAASEHLQSGGRIITMSSLAGQNGGGDGASAYAASKAGVVGLTRAYAKEFGPRGITVNTLSPGYIDDTPFHATFSSDAARQAMVAGSAMRRAGNPDDVAEAVLYLASEGASFVTGTVVDLNGGSYFA
jgi:3-oxoacyl-[acyl-carrier protein] reductase